MSKLDKANQQEEKGPKSRPKSQGPNWSLTQESHKNTSISGSSYASCLADAEGFILLVSSISSVSYTLSTFSSV